MIRLGRKRGIYIGGVAAPPSDPDAEAFFTAAGITDDTQKSAVTQLVISLKASSLWDATAAFYPFVGGTALKHSFNLCNPATFQITWNGGVTHNANGIKGNGTTGYGDTGFNALTSTAINSFHSSFYCRNTNSLSGTYQLGVGDGSFFHLHWFNTGDGHTAFLADGSVNMAAAQASGGMCILNNYGGSSRDIYGPNGLSQLSDSTDISSAILPDATFYLLGGNISGLGQPTDANLAFASLGLKLLHPDQFANIIQTFQTTLGRQV